MYLELRQRRMQACPKVQRCRQLDHTSSGHEREFIAAHKITIASGGSVRPTETGWPCEATGTVVDAAEVAHAAAAVDGGVAVENLLPSSRRCGVPMRKFVARQRREIAGDENVGDRACRPSAEKRQRALIAVAAVDPLETARIAIVAVQRRLAAIDAVQVVDPALQARVLRLACSKIPIERGVVVPFVPLAEFARP